MPEVNVLHGACTAPGGCVCLQSTSIIPFFIHSNSLHINDRTVTILCFYFFGHLLLLFCLFKHTQKVLKANDGRRKAYTIISWPYACLHYYVACAFFFSRIQTRTSNICIHANVSDASFYPKLHTFWVKCGISKTQKDCVSSVLHPMHKECSICKKIQQGIGLRMMLENFSFRIISKNLLLLLLLVRQRAMAFL